MTDTVSLERFLAAWLTQWPPATTGPGLTIAASPDRLVPTWDGSIRPMVGVEAPDGRSVISVAPEAAQTVRALGPTLAEVGPGLGSALGRPDWRFGRGVMRWSAAPTNTADDGVWLPTTDSRIPEWLQPFNGDVLVALDATGENVLAGVGRKQHNELGHEIAVVTAEAARGQGWATRLVAQAARRILDDGAIPIYLHAEDNAASARTADASGFPDLGWRVLGLFPKEST